MSGRYIRQKPYVDEYGIYIPEKEYVPEGCVSVYHCIMTKEMFTEAYRKWIKDNIDEHLYYSSGEDDADCWSDD